MLKASLTALIAINKFIYAAILVFLNDFPNVSVILISIIHLIFGAFIFKVRPYFDNLLNYKIGIQYISMVITHIFLGILIFDLEETTKNIISWIFISIQLLNLLLNLGLLLYNCKKRKNIQQNGKKALEKICNCFRKKVTEEKKNIIIEFKVVKDNIFN